MAKTIVNAVLERRFGSVTRKAVAYVLADHASVTDEGAWMTIVGQKRIGAEAEVSERTVRDVLRDFEDEGLIRRRRRHRQDGSRTSDQITLDRDAVAALPGIFEDQNLPAAASASPPADSAGSDGGPTGSSQPNLPAALAEPTGRAFAGQEPSEEPSVEPDSDLLPTVVDHTAADSKPSKSDGRRDVIWDTLGELFGEPTNSNTRGRRNRVVKLLKESDATPDEIRHRAAAWPFHFGDATLTDTALANHWDTLGRPPARASQTDISRLEDARRRQQRRLEAERLEAEKRGLSR